MSPFSNSQPGRPLAADGLVDRASAFLFAVKESGAVITRAIRERLGPEHSGNLVVATLGALAHGAAERPRDLESATGASSAVLLRLTEQGRHVEIVAALVSSLDHCREPLRIAADLLAPTDGPVRPVNVSTMLGLTTGATSKLLDRMETAGFVLRTDGGIAEDRRGVEVSATAIGDSRLVLISTNVVDHSAEILHAFRLLEDLNEQLSTSSRVVIKQRRPERFRPRRAGPGWTPPRCRSSREPR